ncbi:DMT family transporter [Roseomonas sp. OT10]|uniref:DMT family transporter n=1 Tax=Roseomonas cutis TaxID=2897332 RepID=UPI001E2912B6|nr:DMT family transporter [Roseomonas sp. OT10]UFN51294.1 DMT family transporter [Roseomonas sp. OT10]
MADRERGAPPGPSAAPPPGPAGRAATPAAPASAGPTLPAEDTLRGIGLIAFAYFVTSCSDAAMKWALPEIGEAMAMAWRGLFGALSVAAAARLARRSRAGKLRLRPVNAPLVFWRSGLNCLVTLGFYIAWHRGMALADTYAVSSTTPLVMTLLAIPLLGEQVGWRRWTSTGIGFLGVLFMLQPGGALWRWEVAMVLGTIGILALTRIWTRTLARTDSAATVAFWVMAAQVPGGLLMLPFFPPAHALPAPGTMLVLVLLGSAHGMAHLLFSRAFALAPVSVLAPFEYTPLLWGVLLGLLIWGDRPAATTLAGAAVVAAAGLYNLHRERLRARERMRASAARAVETPP